MFLVVSVFPVLPELSRSEEELLPPPEEEPPPELLELPELPELPPPGRAEMVSLPGRVSSV